jgi:heme a synthase
MTLFQVGLRRAAAQLSRSAFVRGQCFKQHHPTFPSFKIIKLACAATAARAYSSPSIASQLPKTNAQIPIPKDEPASSAKQSSWPEQNPKSVAYWLIGSAVSVFGIVVFGGLTRLTESGYVS